MSNYTKATNFTVKDTTHDTVLGSEHDTEYTAIQTAIATKADIASPTFTGTVTLPTVAGNRTDSGNINHSGSITMSGKSIYAANASVAANATTSDIWSSGNYVTLTGGVVTFTDFADAPQAGVEVEVYCNAAHVFTDNANLEIDGDANWTAEAGDRVLVRAKSTTVFTLHPIKKTGRAIIEVTPGLVYLDTQTAAGAANISFTTGLNSTYDEYELVLTGGTVSVDDASLSLVVSTDGGSNYLGTAIYQDSLNFAATVRTAQTQIYFNDGGAGNGVGAAPNETFDIRLRIHKPSGSTYKHFGWVIDYTRPAGTLYSTLGTGEVGTTTAINALRIAPSSGTLTVTGRLYGLRKS